MTTNVYSCTQMRWDTTAKRDARIIAADKALLPAGRPVVVDPAVVVRHNLPHLLVRPGGPG